MNVAVLRDLAIACIDWLIWLCRPNYAINTFLNPLQLFYDRFSGIMALAVCDSAPSFCWFQQFPVALDIFRGKHS
jgi:hypothetical protein